MKTVDSILEPLLELPDLALILRRSPGAIKNDLSRNPEAVPPRLVLPNCRLLRWRPSDVTAWMQNLMPPVAQKGARHD